MPREAGRRGTGRARSRRPSYTRVRARSREPAAANGVRIGLGHDPHARTRGGGRVDALRCTRRRAAGAPDAATGARRGSRRGHRLRRRRSVRSDVRTPEFRGSTRTPRLGRLRRRSARSAGWSRFPGAGKGSGLACLAGVQGRARGEWDNALARYRICGERIGSASPWCRSGDGRRLRRAGSGMDPPEYRSDRRDRRDEAARPGPDVAPVFPGLVCLRSAGHARTEEGIERARASSRSCAIRRGSRGPS